MSDITTREWDATPLQDTELNIDSILEAENLIDLISSEELAKIGSFCKERFDTDYGSNKDWRTEVEKIRKAAAQISEKKTTPWTGAANIKYPLITTAALQFNARAYPIIINE